MTETLQLGSRTASPDSAVIVIAEIGVNHDGSVARALDLVRAAHRAGADGIKLQVFRASTLVNGRGVLAAYQKSTTDAESSSDLLRRYELSENDLRTTLDLARSLGLLAIATPFSPSDIPVCQRLNLDAIKIASPDLINVPLLLAAAETRLPLLISTGAATLDEIDDTRRLLALQGAPHLLMHCVSAYPTSDGQAHLCFIADLRKRFGTLIGYSDHADSTLAGALAVTAGAILLERHLTYHTGAQGPDHAASSDERMFTEYVALVRQATRLRGSGHKRLLAVEQDVRTVSRQSLVLTRDTAAGEPLTASHLTVQRPGTGILANDYPKALGRRAARSLQAGTLLTWDMLAA